MFHACFMTIPTCFVHTLYHFYAFSGTNLLMRCRKASCCFLLFLVSEILVRKYFRNRTKSTPKVLEIREASRAPEKGQRGARGAPHPRAARPKGGGAPPYGVGTPWPLRLRLSAYIFVPDLKTSRSWTETEKTIQSLRHRESPIRGTEVAVLAPCRDGELPPEPSPPPSSPPSLPP